MQKQSPLLEELTNCKSVVWQESFKKKGLVTFMNGASRSRRMRHARDFPYAYECVCVCGSLIGSIVPKSPILFKY